VKKKVYLTLWLLILSTLLLLSAACGSNDSNAAPERTPTPSLPPTLVTALQKIDEVLKAAIQGHASYAIPAEVQLDESMEVQLQVTPFATAEELNQQLMAMATAQEVDITITPLMKAELISADSQAFTIQALHASPEQVMLSDVPTEWRWSLTAKKSGSQTLMITLYRQVEYNGQYYWRTVETFENKIQVNMTAKQRFEKFDWKWLAGILLTALLIPAFWRLIDRKKKKKPARKHTSR
jgi:hypothetical protein